MGILLLKNPSYHAIRDTITLELCRGDVRLRDRLFDVAYGLIICQTAADLADCAYKSVQAEIEAFRAAGSDFKSPEWVDLSARWHEAGIIRSAASYALGPLYARLEEVVYDDYLETHDCMLPENQDLYDWLGEVSKTVRELARTEAEKTLLRSHTQEALHY